MADPEAFTHPPTRTPEAFTVPGSLLLQQTIDERDRIENDGGTINNGLVENLIDPVLKDLDDAGQLSSVSFLGAAGAREVASGSMATIYDWSGNSDDATQASSSQRFTDSTSADFAGKVVGDADGTDDFLSVQGPETAFEDFTWSSIAVGEYATSNFEPLFTSGDLRAIVRTNNSNGVETRIDDGSTSVNPTSTNSTIPLPVIHSSVADAGDVTNRFNGGNETSASGTLSTTAATRLELGARSGTTYLGGVFTALILIDAAISDSLLSSLETTVNDYYSVY